MGHIYGSKLDIMNKDYIKKLKDICIYDKSKYNQIDMNSYIRTNLPVLQIDEELLKEGKEPVEIEIRKPTISEKLFTKHKKRYNFYVNEINSKNDYEYYKYVQEEDDKKYKVKMLKKEHEIKINEIIKDITNLYLNKDEALISSFTEELLKLSKYPFEFKKNISTSYHKDIDTLIINYSLPDMSIVNVYENQKENELLYDEIIHSIMYISVLEVFKSDTDNNIDKIVFNGYVNELKFMSDKFNKNDINENNLYTKYREKLLKCI